MGTADTVERCFDHGHYAATALQKVERSLQLGPKYFLWELPRYFLHRRRLALPLADLAALVNPLREFRRTTSAPFPPPPGYRDALEQFAAAGMRFTIPRLRLEGLVSAWWEARETPGNVIECGSYRGATGLFLALLGKMHGVEQRVLLLDTFSGAPAYSAYDTGRGADEFVPAGDAVNQVRQQAAVLGVEDRIEIHQGLFADTFRALTPRRLEFSFAHIDANLYQSTKEACAFTIPRMSGGGLVVFDDYNAVCDLGARLAIDENLAGTGTRPTPLATCSAYLRFAPACTLNGLTQPVAS
ncbi:MAG TPA: TylF/MycF/NovP-related O-methyltransferase [Gemmataceae bacterium]|nr:TylF/MycF/NovP-related O-methyltransferase [Gemmataceae bacterium]